MSPSTGTVAPPRSAFTRVERALIDSLPTPQAVQRWLRAQRYNRELDGPTLRGFRGVARDRTAHCLEAALFAATVLEQHGYPPLLLSLESVDLLDHVLFTWRGPKGWGTVGRSRDEGLHGRRPRFATPRALALSYYDPYVDLTGRIKAYALVDLRELAYDWRLRDGNLWRVERWLREVPHRPIQTSDIRYRQLHTRYRAWKAAHPDRPPDYYRGVADWI